VIVEGAISHDCESIGDLVEYRVKYVVPLLNPTSVLVTYVQALKNELQSH
jgi:hypothetical protein